MDAVGVSAVLTGTAAVIGAVAQLIRELRRDKSQPRPPEDTQDQA